MRVPWLIPTPYPSLPPAESDHVLLLAQRRQVEEVMEKLQQFNRSLGLMLVAVEGAQHHLEKHLQDLHTVLHPAGEPGIRDGCWRAVGCWWVPTPSSCSPFCRLDPKCHLHLHSPWLLLCAAGRAAGGHAIPCHPPPRFPCLQCPWHPSALHIPGFCCGRWGGVGRDLVGNSLPQGSMGLGWGCLALSHPLASPTGQWVLMATSHSAGEARIRPCHWLTSTPTR